ncbi:MAG: epoxyqueuosine reductase QueH [Lachnospiraceae bacterium]|nr:epoxyqueuosine reductase QueH [Lachnospiraceae bacterium]
MTQNKRNYQKEMEKTIEGLQGNRKSLLLHSCCAPCSSAVLEKLQEIFDVTVFFYNPNISENEEYRKRVEEQKRLIETFNQQMPAFPIKMIEGDYEPQEFYNIAKGWEKCPEGGERCFRCFALRLEKTAWLAKEGNYDFFTTTLTISPLKNAAKLNEIGEEMARKYKTVFLPSDFKKKEGYKRSIELSKIYDLYRQNFCGCVFSKAESKKREGNMEG